MNRHTKEAVLAAWRRVLTADLPPNVTAARIAEVVGINHTSARQWLTRHLGTGSIQPGPKGGLVGWWPTAEIQTAVKDMEGPGNRSENRGKGRAPKTSSDQTRRKDHLP